jgi:hypothetical protein
VTELVVQNQGFRLTANDKRPFQMERHFHIDNALSTRKALVRRHELENRALQSPGGALYQLCYSGLEMEHNDLDSFFKKHVESGNLLANVAKLGGEQVSITLPGQQESIILIGPG